MTVISPIGHATVFSPEQSAAESPLPLWKHLVAFFVSHHVTEGLAKIYGFEVLRHGTSIPKYINILKNGVDPLMGGNGIGNFNPAKDDDEQKMRGCWRTFHMYKDIDRENAWESDKLTVVAGVVQLVAGVVLTMVGLGWAL